MSVEMIELGISGGNFPKQKIPTSKKNNITFIKKCVDSAVELANTSSGLDTTRMSRFDMSTNYDLVDGILNKDDVFKISNPWGLEGFDRSIVSYQLIKPRINLLLGEEFARIFDWLIKVTNYEAINEKEEALFKRIFKEAAEIALQENYDEAAAKTRLEELTDELSLSIQDRREAMATDILTYETYRLLLGEKFNKGFSDAIIAAEEIYHVSSYGNKPDVRVINPLTLFVVGHNEDSFYIEDSDIIIEDAYYPPGYIIDKYYDYLTPAEIDKIEAGTEISPVSIGETSLVNYTNGEPSNILSVDVNISSSDVKLQRNTRAFDGNGNVRVVMVTWRSRRKIGELTYTDENDNIIKDYVTEDFVADEGAGQKVRWLWPSEWWFAARIGDSIYPKCWGPRKPITTNTDCPFVSTSGYVGTIYKINSNRAYSIVSSLKSYQYLYDELMDRLKEALAKYQGPMMELDIAKMPADWKPEQWLYYARKLGYLIIDSFKEVDKGAHKGTLAGSFNTTGRVLNPDLGQYIQQILLMLNYIEDRVGEVTGINRQRLGTIESKELVGTTERAVTQSNHITERLYEMHNNTKLRVLTELLNVAKFLYKDSNEKLQYITDDMNAMILHLDGFALNSADYALFVTNASSDPMLVATLKQLVQAAMQNGTVTIGQAVDLLTSKRIGAVRRSLKESDRKVQENKLAEQKAAQETQKQMIAAQTQMTDQQIGLAKQNIEKDVVLKQMDVTSKLTVEELKEKLKQNDIALAEKVLEEEIRTNKANEELKSKDIEAKKTIAASKPKPTNSK